MKQATKLALTTALSATLAAIPLTITTNERGFVTLSVPVAWAKDGESGGNSGPGGGGDSDGGSSGSGSGGDDSDGGNSGPGSGGDDSDGGNSGPGGGGDDSDGGNSGSGGGGDDSDGGNSGSGSGDDDNSGPGNSDDDDRDSRSSRDDDDDDGRRGRKGRGLDDDPNHHGREVTFADGSKIEIENGRFERKNALGRTVEERPATPQDFENLANARSTQATAPRGAASRAKGGGTVASFEISGRNIEVNYVDGWKEEIENGQYELKDANNNTVVERTATRQDRSRLFGAFE